MGKTPFMILSVIRWILGRLILTFDWIFRPTPLRRSPEEQVRIDVATRALKLYQFHACPFCVKVRRQIRRLALQIDLRDAQHDPQARKELLSGGGEIQVPCLRIEDAGTVRWLYESSDINAYLMERFGNAAK